HRSFGDGVSEVLEDNNDFILRADDRVLRADRTANTGKRNVNSRLCNCGGSLFESSLDFSFNFRLEFVDALADLALRFFGRGFQPEFVELGENAVFAREPVIAVRVTLVSVHQIRGSLL